MRICSTTLLTLALVTASAAHGAVSVEEPWVRATAPGQAVAGAYLRLRSDTPVALVAVETSASKKAEIHEMRMEGQVMRMRPVEKIALPAGQSVELRPGGYHLMLIDVIHPLKPGDKVPLTLVIESASGARQRIAVEAQVREIAAPAHRH